MCNGDDSISKYVLSDSALADLQSIAEYIARESPVAAESLLEEFGSAFERLAHHPAIGHLRSDFTSRPFRFWRVRSYFVVYCSNADSVEIARVLSSHRDVAKLLTQS